ncbi:MAG: hypothetical protein NZM42_01175 [Gemmatales bacterium]|nr:hypothetical protein [Gemmatales bacterium]MDW8221474.1 hypothetical protein [Gemmatales bacterium]
MTRGFKMLYRGRRYGICVLTMLVLSGLLGWLHDTQQDFPMSTVCAQTKGDEQLAQLMKRKMEAAQKILEGLALAQFDTVITNAEALIFISRQASFRVLPTPEYELHSNEFRRVAGEIANKAREKNLDGATLQYMDMTLTCVKCHKHVRDRRGTHRDGGERPSSLASRNLPLGLEK